MRALPAFVKLKRDTSYSFKKIDAFKNYSQHQPEYSHQTTGALHGR